MPFIVGVHRVAQEREALGYRSLWSGVQGPNVRSPVTDRIFIVQEQPYHPASRFWIAPPPVPQQIPFVRGIRVIQELPWHPSSFFHAGRAPLEYEDRQFFIIL